MRIAVPDTRATHIREQAIPLEDRPGDLDPIVEQARDREIVLIGEASHGTREFYRMRAELTRRLIEEAGFDAVAVEGDWPDVYRLNRFVRGEGDRHAGDAFSDFDRFPRWMWRNLEVLDFVRWLESHDQSLEPRARAGIYGLDLYSLYRSAEHVIAYLAERDPEAADRARERYACLGAHGEPQRYGHDVALGLTDDCEADVVAQLTAMLERRTVDLAANGLLAEDAHFFAETNARLVRNAEAYYRGMFSSFVNTWNLRDEHMAEVLYRLQAHLSAQRGRPARIVVWAHNSHLGDARATDRAVRGELNLGQLVRETSGEKSLAVGFSTFTGHVTAARDWSAPAEHRWVRPGLEGGIERLCRQTELDRFLLPLGRRAPQVLDAPLLERAIGVIYRPETERASHYLAARVGAQFDWLIHLDETSALEPMDTDDRWRRPEPPETWPFGL